MGAKTQWCSVLHSCLWSEGSACLREGGPRSSAWSTAPLQAGSPHPFHPINPLWICFPPLSLSFSVLVSTLTQMYQCPYCKFTNTDLNRLRMHVMTQHSVQPMLRCPLCQDMLNNKIHLQFHLTHLHSVAPDCVDKLIATVSPVLCFYLACDWILGGREDWSVNSIFIFLRKQCFWMIFFTSLCISR